jgi:hypothetical protein
VRYLLRILVGSLMAVSASIACQDSTSDQAVVVGSNFASEVRIDLLPAQVKGQVGETILFSIQAYANQGFSAADIEISFDAQYVRAIAFGDGDALGPSPLRGADNIDNSAGSARIALARVGPSDIDGSAESTLATIMLEIVGSSGDTPMVLDIARIELVDAEYNLISGVITNQAFLDLEQ